MVFVLYVWFDVVWYFLYLVLVSFFRLRWFLLDCGFGLICNCLLGLMFISFGFWWFVLFVIWLLLVGMMVDSVDFGFTVYLVWLVFCWILNELCWVWFVFWLLYVGLLICLFWICVLLICICVSWDVWVWLCQNFCRFWYLGVFALFGVVLGLAILLILVWFLVGQVWNLRICLFSGFVIWVIWWFLLCCGWLWYKPEFSWFWYFGWVSLFDDFLWVGWFGILILIATCSWLGLLVLGSWYLVFWWFCSDWVVFGYCKTEFYLILVFWIFIWSDFL